MTRVLSGAVLVSAAVLVVWFASPLVFLIAAEGLAVLAVLEYATLARASGLAIPAVASGAAVVLTAFAFTGQTFAVVPHPMPADVLMLAMVVLGVLALSRWRGGQDAVGAAAAAIFPAVYIGLPIGALVAVRETRGPEGLFLLMLTVMVSDTAQYYSGRAFGRRPLAPAISPKKTMEGAAGGFVFGGALMAIVGAWWLPAIPAAARGILGIALVGFGIAGDLFESMLKRSAGVKDSSALIPGHGGVLDRIDALLFTAPVYYVVLRYL